MRSLKERYENNPEGEPTSLKQIENLYRRLDLIRWMQVLGASSLLVSLVAMFLYYLEWNVAGGVVSASVWSFWRSRSASASGRSRSR